MLKWGCMSFFGCYYNLFELMQRVNAFQHLRVKEHTHTFVNRGGVTGGTRLSLHHGRAVQWPQGLFLRPRSCR